MNKFFNVLSWGRQRWLLRLALLIFLLPSRSRGQDIFDAIANTNADRVTTLLKAQPDLVSARDTNNFTPLMVATARRCPHIVQLLLDAKSPTDGAIRSKDWIWNLAHLATKLSAAHDTQLKYEILKQIFQFSPVSIATINKDTVIMNLLIAHGASLESRDILEETPLDYAALHGDLNMTELLLKHHAKIESRTDPVEAQMRRIRMEIIPALFQMFGANFETAKFLTAPGVTPMMFAAAGGSVPVARMLAEHGARINVHDETGVTPLFLAVKYPDMISFLLSQHAKVNTETDNGVTPLLRAAAEGCAHSVQLLLSAGADIEAHDDNGYTPLLAATENNHADVVALLLDHHANTETRNKDGNDALQLVANFIRPPGDVSKSPPHGPQTAGDKAGVGLTADTDQYEVADLLLQRGWQDPEIAELKATLAIYRDRLADLRSLLADHPELISARNNRQATLLHLALENPHQDIINFLLTRHPDLTAMDQLGNTPLLMAAALADPSPIQALLAAGADANQKDLWGQPALVRAATYGRTNNIELLLAAGAGIEVPDNLGNTPAFAALGHHRYDAVNMLLKHGASLNGHNKDGYTAQQIALSQNDQAMVKLSSQYGQHDLEAEAFMAAQTGDLNSLRQLLAAHPEVISFRNNLGFTILHSAAYNKHLDAVKFLLSHHADLSAKSKLGWTALSLAASAGAVDVVAYLLDAGADPNPTPWGDSPLRDAIDNGQTAIADLLRQHGGR